MVQGERKQLARDDWLKAALNQCTAGIDTVKVAPLAEQLGVTTGSFYWHFKNRRELLEAMLEYWEREMTVVALDAAKRHPAEIISQPGAQCARPGRFAVGMKPRGFD